ncbi:MAG: tRNA (cytidine(56)-2'-O)-methyltransferase [Candidatus Anstonellaceae archaeon]
MTVVFRYGHRIVRDKRLTSHVFLVARAFLIKSGFYCGEKDQKLEDSIRKVGFELEYCENCIEKLLELKNEGKKIVHLTMYGEPILKKIEEIKNEKEKLVIIVGSKKVQKEIYEIADYNISITYEPHSEVGALAIFLNEIFESKALLDQLKDKEAEEKAKKILRNKINKVRIK